MLRRSFRDSKSRSNEISNIGGAEHRRFVRRFPASSAILT
jgi:hypothetical protein